MDSFFSIQKLSATGAFCPERKAFFISIGCSLPLMQSQPKQMKYEITKSFRFEAAHSLPHLPECHQCHRLHGHSYELTVGVSGPVIGEWVQDYADISAVVSPLVKRLDHYNLNEVLSRPTTAENLAQWIWSHLAASLPLLSRIEVRETPTSNVILTRE